MQLVLITLFEVPGLILWQRCAWLHTGCVVLQLLAESLRHKLQTAPYLPGIKITGGLRAVMSQTSGLAKG